MVATNGRRERALTIGIDARAAAEVAAGRGRVVRELLRALAGGGTRTSTAATPARAGRSRSTRAFAGS